MVYFNCLNMGITELMIIIDVYTLSHFFTVAICEMYLGIGWQSPELYGIFFTYVM